MVRLAGCARELGDEVRKELEYIRGVAFVLYQSMGCAGIEADRDQTAAARCIYEMADRLVDNLDEIIDKEYGILRDLEKESAEKSTCV